VHDHHVLLQLLQLLVPSCYAFFSHEPEYANTQRLRQ
jgi:hypothetical protein